MYVRDHLVKAGHGELLQPATVEVPGSRPVRLQERRKQKGRQMTGAGTIAAMRVGIKRTLRQHSSHRPGLRLWVLLRAQSLLDGPGSGAHAIAFIEDDYRRLAARRQETLERRA
jgi:hypothetical protein